MITPSYSITATERVLPNLVLDWTTGLAQPGVDVARASIATFVGSDGLIQSAIQNTQRVDWTSGISGLLVEESRTNVLLNSLIDGTNLTTQSVVVTAAARTLSFYGDGEIVLSGAHSATVSGLGVYPTRTTLTFTPSAGILTLTVTGTVQFAQLETGAFATSFIPTNLSQVTRVTDFPTITGSNFSNWFNALQGTLYAEGTVVNNIVGTTARTYANLNNAGGTEIFSIEARSSTNTRARSLTGGVTVLAGDTFGVLGIEAEIIGSYASSGIAMSVDARAPITAVSNVPSLDRMIIGINAAAQGASCVNGQIKRISYWPQKLTLAELQAFTK